jgi:hypothetical protein
MNQLKVISDVLDKCSKSQLESVFAAIANLPSSCTREEMISHCLNIELRAYGFQSYTSPYKTRVLINDEGMCKVMDFFKDIAYQSVLTRQHIDCIGTVVDFADKGEVYVLWA